MIFAGLISLAPMAPDRPENERTDQAGSTNRSRAGKLFNYIPDEEVFALELDPRRVRFGLLEGWSIFDARLNNRPPAGSGRRRFRLKAESVGHSAISHLSRQQVRG